MKRKIVFWAGAVLAFNAAFGTICTWTGGGDGLRFGYKDNWDTGSVPLSGWHTIILTHAVEGAVFSNDLGAVAVYRFKIRAGSNWFKLADDMIALMSNGRKPSSTSYAFECEATESVEVACSLAIDNTEGSAYARHFNCHPGVGRHAGDGVQSGRRRRSRA